MCLAIPMQIVELKTDGTALGQPKVAVVSADGIRNQVRLDIVDRCPKVGDFVIVHAGFAIHTLNEKQAAESLRLLREMAGIL